MFFLILTLGIVVTPASTANFLQSEKALFLFSRCLRHLKVSESFLFAIKYYSATSLHSRCKLWHGRLQFSNTSRRRKLFLNICSCIIAPNMSCRIWVWVSLRWKTSGVTPCDESQCRIRSGSTRAAPVWVESDQMWGSFAFFNRYAFSKLYT